MADDEYIRNVDEGDTGAQPLSEDNDTPFSPPTDITDSLGNPSLDSTHQALDTNVDPHEVYDEGLSGAAEAQEPNAGNAVEGYNPGNDSRRNEV